MASKSVDTPLPVAVPPTRPLTDGEKHIAHTCEYLYGKEYPWNPTNALGLYVCVIALIHYYSYNLNRQAQGLRIAMENLMDEVERREGITKEKRNELWVVAHGVFARDFRERLERERAIQEEEFAKSLLRDPGCPAAQGRIKLKRPPFDKISDDEQKELLKKAEEWERRWKGH